MKPLSILVTGGTGYIGSHTVVELHHAGHKVFVIDNLCNSDAGVLDRIERVTGTRPGFAQIDVRDRTALRSLFTSNGFDAVLHFAGLKAVGESVAHPLKYYENNVGGSLTLLNIMAQSGVRRLVFSSSATVYGGSIDKPITEDSPLDPANPYGRSKLVVEDILRDVARTGPDWRIAMLRYFNPAGAHPSGWLGERPNGTPSNLMPYLAMVAANKLPQFQVFGNHYPTPDGTGVRDYIHVSDLAQGHLAALACLAKRPGILTVNLGTGRGYSVLEMIRGFSTACGRDIPYRVVEPRPGDVARCLADPTLARQILNWSAAKGIDEMCVDAWRWQQNCSEI